MILSRNRNSEVKAIAKLNYLDVSDDPWDIQNLTKEKLDFSTDSIVIIDTYIKRLKQTDYLNKNLITFSSRIGAYVGEVIRRNLSRSHKYNWHDYNAINRQWDKKEYNDVVYQQEVLFSRKTKDYMLPKYQVFLHLIDKSNKDSLYKYVVKMVSSHK